MKPCRKDESSNDIADVVDLRDQEHVHHEDKTEKGRTCHPIQLEEDQFEEDGSQGASVSWVEEISGMVVGDNEAEESWTTPHDVIRVWKFLQI